MLVIGLAVISQLKGVTAYLIDPISCGEHVDIIQESLDAAFELAQEASSALGRASFNPKSRKTWNEQRFAGMIFGKYFNKWQQAECKSDWHC